MTADTTVLLELPADLAEGFDSESRPGYKLRDDFERLKDARIMMVDDERITMEVVQNFLEDVGYHDFVLVEDSTEAMRQLQKQQPDILLLDIIMPEIDGFEILKELRKDPDLMHLPVIILTSSLDAKTKLTALDLGATDFLSKPVDPSELALRVRNTLAAKAYQDQLAYYDILTNLPNSHLFQDRVTWAIERARREELNVALLHIRFDAFERINDTLGPEVGNELLKQLADRLTRQVRASDPVTRHARDGAAWADVFRVGSADFSLLLPSIDNIANVTTVGQRILDDLKAPFHVLGNEMYLAPSIGVAAFPEDAADTASLIKCALNASSQVREEGSRRLQFYSTEANLAAIQRYRLETELRNAIENEEFKLLYQPKVCIDTGSIIGSEALIRWYKEDGAMIPPNDFIPIAEDTGLILPIGEWVLCEACRQIRRWHVEGFKLKVAVNISARQLFETDFIAVVGNAVAEANIDPRYLTLEMTESQLIKNVDQAVQTISQLRKMGIQISMDDFGTGYSSLSYLKQIPLDEVKIDRSFIIDVINSPKDQALVTMITYLAHQFGFQVCAEGVENLRQLQLLKSVECDAYQGYYFSRPIESRKLTEALRAMR